jgi:hypothetical protein
MYDRSDLMWDCKQLRVLSGHGRPLAFVEPDKTWPSLWHVRMPGGYLADTVNLSRAKDLAASLAPSILNKQGEAAA